MTTTMRAPHTRPADTAQDTSAAPHATAEEETARGIAVDGASERAARLRGRAAAISDPVLRPLAVAMKRRAAELELEAAVRRATWS